MSSSSHFVSASRMSLNDIGYNAPPHDYNSLSHHQMAPQQFSHMPMHDQMLLQERRRRRLSSRSVSALNEFDSTKYRGHYHNECRQPPHMWDPRLPSFGMDPDAPVFAPPGSYGRDGMDSRHDNKDNGVGSSIQVAAPPGFI
jgi:hypothetical protein